MSTNLEMRVWECVHAPLCVWPGERAIVCSLHDCPLNNIKVVERENETVDSCVDGSAMQLQVEFMLIINSSICAWVSVAPYAHNFRILNHTSKSSNNWQYHVCTTLPWEPKPQKPNHLNCPPDVYSTHEWYEKITSWSPLFRNVDAWIEVGQLRWGPMMGNSLQ